MAYITECHMHLLYLYLVLSQQGMIFNFPIPGRLIDNLAVDQDVFMPPRFSPEKEYFVQVRTLRAGSTPDNYGEYFLLTCHYSIVINMTTK